MALAMGGGAHVVAAGGQLDVRPSRDELPDGVDIPLAAVTEDDRLMQRGPAEPVDVVHLHARTQKPADDARMPAFAGAD